MGMDRARAKFDHELSVMNSRTPPEHPQPLPVQRLASSERRTRFSDETIETVRSRAPTGHRLALPPLAKTKSTPRIAFIRDGHGPTGSASAPMQPISAWSPPPAISPYLAIDPVRTDYFQTITRERKSWRAFANLAGVIAGRVLITFGTGGLIQGFAPKNALGPGLHARPKGINGGLDGGILVHHVAAGATLTAVGTLVAALAIASFVSDTYRLGPRRALTIGTISYTGLACIVAASVLYVYGQSEDDITVRYLSLLPRAVGNFCLYYSVTNSFPSSELVHGNVPLPNREQCRLIAFATGGACVATWGYLCSPSQNAPTWARELCSSVAIAGLHSGASLSRTDAIRLTSENRVLRSPPRNETPTS